MDGSYVEVFNFSQRITMPLKLQAAKILMTIRVFLNKTSITLTLGLVILNHDFRYFISSAIFITDLDKICRTFTKNFKNIKIRGEDEAISYTVTTRKRMGHEEVFSPMSRFSGNFARFPELFK